MGKMDTLTLAAIALALGMALTASASEGADAGGLSVHGADVLPCLGEAMPPDVYAAEVRRLPDPSVDPAAAAVAIEQLLRSQACLTGLVSPELLAAVRVHDGTAPQADLAGATLKWVVPAGGAAWLDGELVSAEEVAVVAGRHLVQVGPAGEAPVRAALLEVQAGARVLVMVPAALVQHDTGEALGDPPDLVTFRGSRTAPVFLAVGAGLAAIGAVVTAVGTRQLEEFNGKILDGTLSPFPRDSAVNPEDYVYYRVWQSHTRDVTVGCALMGIGAGVMLLSIPIGVAHHRAQVGLTASIPLAPDGPQGFSLGVVVR